MGEGGPAGIICERESGMSDEGRLRDSGDSVVEEAGKAATSVRAVLA